MDREELPNPLSIVGDGQHKILVFDDFLVDPDEIIETASKLAPLFIANERDFYPGVRYKILGDNSDAAGYVKSVCDAIRPAMKHFHGAKDIEIITACFSIVTKSTKQLRLPQTAPHWDGTNDDIFAILHYLGKGHSSGTSLYRHNATGIEKVNAQIVDDFYAKMIDDLQKKPREAKYMNGSDDLFTEIFRIDGKFNRVAIYPSNILHSGNIFDGEVLSANPKIGRLTSNIFIRLLR